MKTRETWAKTITYVSVAGLVCVLPLFAALQSIGKHRSQSSTKLSPSIASKTTQPAKAQENQQWIEAYGKLPLSFEKNVGQTTREVRYVSHGSGYELFLTPQEAVLALRTPISHDLSPRHRFKTMRAIRDSLRARTMTAVRMRFEGANPAARISGLDQLAKRTSYFIGSDPQKWHTDVPSYGRVKYADIYPGVDLVFYGNQRRLEYDFVVAPGADPKAIRLDLEGALKLRINSGGDLILRVPGGEVVLQKPVAYQIVKGERREIVGSYALAKNYQVTFSVPSYDRSEPLVLDPVLNYSTYLGGSGAENGNGAQSFGIAVDSGGNAFVAGTTFSSDFPTTISNAFDPGPPKSGATSGAAFVTEMNPSGTAELYSTYLAGSTGELGVALALDPAGKIYVTGQTFSSDFPTTDGTIAGTLAGFKQMPNLANLNVGTSFISKIDPSISGTGSLVYSSFIGGTSVSAQGLSDFGNAIAVDANGNAYITGITVSPPNAGPVFALTDFPVMNAFQAAPSDATDGNAFLTRIDTTKSGNASLIYSTYLGGTGANAAILSFADAGFGVAVDSSSNAYIVGATASTDFPMTSPTPNGFQTISPVGNTQGTAFLARIDTSKSGAASLFYSTYLGGEVSDFGIGIALGPNNVAYATGVTSSLVLFPTTTGAFQTTGNANGVAFVSLVDTSKMGAASLQYSTFLGGTSGDAGNTIQVDSTGNAYIGGTTTSANFPVTVGAFLHVLSGAKGNGFVSKINPAGGGAADLVYSTFFGGNGTSQEQVFAIALDASDPPNAFITGQTFSTATTFPVFPAGAFQTNLKGTSDAFVAKLTLVPTLAVSPTSLDFGIQPITITSLPQTVTVTNNNNVTVNFSSITIIGTNSADFAKASNTCGTSLAAGAACTVSVTFKPSVTAPESATLEFTDDDASSPQDVSLTGTGSASAPGVGLSPTNLDFGGQLLTTTSAAKTVTLTNNGTAALTITAIATSGDFAQTNTCGTLPGPLAAGANCTVSVTFAPTVLGARTGTLTITDSAGGSPHKVALTGIGWDFTLSAPTTVTVKTGKTVTFNVTITPLGGFNQAVTIACTGTTKPTTCTPTSPVTPADGVTPVTSTVTISTKGMILPPPSTPTPPMSIRQIVPLLVALSLLFCLLITRRLKVRLGMVTAILVMAALVGCSGSKIRKGTSNLTITAASGGVTKTATVALTIN